MLKQTRQFYQTHRWFRWGLQLLILVVIINAVNLWQSRNLATGKAPVIRGKLLNGETIDTSQLDKPLLVYFWATWCPICKAQHGTIESIARDHDVLTIAAWSGSVAEVADYVQEQGTNLRVLVDEGDMLVKQFHVTAVPTSFFVDREGNIRFVSAGYTTDPGYRLRMNWLESH